MTSASRLTVMGVLAFGALAGAAGDGQAADCVVQNDSRLPVKVQVTAGGLESLPVTVPSQYRDTVACGAGASAVLTFETLGAPGIEACRIDVSGSGPVTVVFKAPVQTLPYKTYECVVR